MSSGILKPSIVGFTYTTSMEFYSCYCGSIWSSREISSRGESCRT